MCTVESQNRTCPEIAGGLQEIHGNKTANLRTGDKPYNLVVDFRQEIVNSALNSGNVELAEFVIDSICRSLSQIIENMKPPETENKDVLKRKLEKLKEYREKLERKEEEEEEYLMEKLRIEFDDLQKWLSGSVVISPDCSFV